MAPYDEGEDLPPHYILRQSPFARFSAPTEKQPYPWPATVFCEFEGAGQGLDLAKATIIIKCLTFRGDPEMKKLLLASAIILAFAAIGVAVNVHFNPMAVRAQPAAPPPSP